MPPPQTEVWSAKPPRPPPHTHMPTHNGLQDPCGDSMLTVPSLVKHNGTRLLKITQVTDSTESP